MRIAVAQIEAIKGNVERNLAKHVRWIREAISNNAYLVVFPELSLTGYEPDLAAQLATTQDDVRLDKIQDLSDNHGICIGIGLPTKRDGNTYVSMVIFRPFKERITYSKQYLYPTEVSVFTPATNPLVLEFETEIIAPAICYELSNKEHYEFAAQNNATVYLASVLNSVNGVDGDLTKLSAIARDYKMVTFMANYVGESGGYTCAGKSSVWNEHGELIGQLGDTKEGLLIYDTKLKEIRIGIRF
jgi:predicted amidohydrolase